MTARFEQAPRVRHAAEPSNGGWVEVSGTDRVTSGAASDVDFVYSGRTVTFTATPVERMGGFGLGGGRVDLPAVPTGNARSSRRTMTCG